MTEDPSTAPGERPTIRLLHHLARSGGTIISKCLAVMPGVALLSEINPCGVQIYNPLDQADRWFSLFDGADRARLAAGERFNFPDAITLIEARARARSRILVIRDWSHLDFMAAPFVQDPGYRLTLAEELAARFTVVNTASVRHPLHEWQSLRKLGVIQNKLDLATYLQGYRRFADEAVRIGFVRYEDFTVDPDTAMQTLCTRLPLTYDPGYRVRQADYSTITGAATATGDIRPAAERAADPLLAVEMAGHAAYGEALELLGYSHPD